MSAARDVVVIGSGHNGLVAACYLARAGLDVEVLESDVVLGGAVSTVERWPGYLVDRGSSAHIMVRHTGIVEDLALSECGLTYLDLDPWGFAPFGVGDERQAITFYVDLDRTCASIESVCGSRDADAYRRFVIDWSSRNEAVFAAFQDAPTPSRLGRHLWAVGRHTDVGGLELSRQFLQSADQLLDEHFADERLKTALAWLAAQAGPSTADVATADLVGWNTLMHKLPPGRAVGGSGALTSALAERLRRLGGTIRLGDGVREIVRAGDRVTGVRMQSGQYISSRAVVAGCHVLSTLELLGDEALLSRATRAVRVGNGIGMAVRFGTTALPSYPSAGSEAVHPAMQLLASSRAQLRSAHGEFGAGRTPTDPPVLVMSYSGIDPSIAPPGRHNVTAWAQWHPYDISDGSSWDDIGAREADKVVARVEEMAPGFAAGIEHRHVQTPLDLERELGLRRGNVMHVNMGLDSMFTYRPLPELSGYRTPVRGLYLTGASTHPGGGVFGASGRSTARAALRDRGQRRTRW